MAELGCLKRDTAPNGYATITVKRPCSVKTALQQKSKDACRRFSTWSYEYLGTGPSVHVAALPAPGPTSNRGCSNASHDLFVSKSFNV